MTELFETSNCLDFYVNTKQILRPLAANFSRVITACYCNTSALLIATRILGRNFY